MSMEASELQDLSDDADYAASQQQVCYSDSYHFFFLTFLVLIQLDRNFPMEHLRLSEFVFIF